MRRACEAASPCPRRKTVSSRRPGRVAPCSRYQPRGSGADAGNFAHPLGRIVEHFAERVAEVFGDSARTHRTDAFYFRGKVAFDRDGARRPQRFVVDDVELFAEALMLLEAALRADGRADFEAGEIADYGDAAVVAMLERHDHDRHRVAVLVIDEQDLIENALERLVRFNCTCHGKRITRAACGVQLTAMRASTGGRVCDRRGLPRFGVEPCRRSQGWCAGNTAAR